MTPYRCGRTISFIMVVVALFVFSSCAAIGMKNLPEGELINSVYSPDKSHVINAYLVNGGATVDFSVRCEVREVSSDDKRNIYWNYHCESAEVEWIDNETVSINSIILNIYKDSYDWREE